MKYFCDHCNNLLSATTTNDELMYMCMTCYASYNSNDDDTLRYEETTGGNLIIFQTILKQASGDPVNLKEYVTCPKCKHKIAKRVRLGAEMRLINVCDNSKCRFQWIAVI